MARGVPTRQALEVKRIAPWLLPTLMAPLLGASLYVFVLAQGSRLPSLVWWLAGFVAAGFAFVVGALMAATDVALLRLRLRTLPTGWRVWLMGLAAPWPVFWSWQKLVKLAIVGLPQLLLVFFLPMLATALVMRIALGTRPATWRD